jgi:hypothetical protein
MGGLIETGSIYISITTSVYYYCCYLQHICPHIQLFLDCPCSNPVDHNTPGISSPRSALAYRQRRTRSDVHGSTKAHVHEINHQTHGPPSFRYTARDY